MGSPLSSVMTSDMVAATGVLTRARVPSIAINMPIYMPAALMEATYGVQLGGAVRPSVWRLIEVVATQHNPFTSHWCVGVAGADQAGSTHAEADGPSRRRSRWSLFRM
ncbi:MAG: hypothetical protein IPL79_10590 [Myxococcales bacterium]|nr:hypothetical protein [Myxococcales bacterium]